MISISSYFISENNSYDIVIIMIDDNSYIIMIIVIIMIDGWSNSGSCFETDKGNLAL